MVKLFIRLNTFFRGKKMWALLLLCFAVFAGPATACVFGFADGYPRPITLVPKKSALISGVPVRLLKNADGAAVHVPTPDGFRDIETLTRKMLPERLHVPAWNLREHTMTFVVWPRKNPKPANAMPRYSLAEFSFLPDTSLYAPSLGVANEQRPACADLWALDSEQSKARAAESWRAELEAAEKAPADVAQNVCERREGDGALRVHASSLVRDWMPGEKERAYKENPYATGGFSPYVPAVEASVAFPHDGFVVFMSISLGPVDEKRVPELLREAVSEVLLWKKNFQTVNQ